MLSTVFLELTNRCNMDCNFCPSHMMSRPRGTMSTDLAFRTIDQLREMRFSGTLITSLMGEPLLHPDFRNIVAHSVTAGIRTTTITNALLVPRKITAEELLDLGLDTLVLSYQTPDQTSFAKRRAGIEFARYRDQIGAILSQTGDARIRTGRIEVHLLHTLHNRINTRMIEDGAEIRSSILDIRTMIPGGGASSSTVEAALRDFLFGKQYWDTFAIPIGEKVSVVLKRSNTWANRMLPEGCTVTPRSRGHCGAFHSTLGILWDGRCTVCCQDFDGEICIGDAAHTPLSGIWEGEALRVSRMMEKKGILVHEACTRCKGQICKDGRPFSLIQPQKPIVRAGRFIAKVRRRLATLWNR